MMVAMIEQRHVFGAVGLLELALVWLSSSYLVSVSCAGGRLSIGGGPSATMAGRAAPGTARLHSKPEQHTIMMTKQAVGPRDDHHYQDLIRMHELEPTAIRWRGVNSANELAPESQVVGLQFGQHRPAAGNDLKLIQADKLRLAQTASTLTGGSQSKTKQSQEFETHEGQQDGAAAGSSSGRPLADEVTSSTPTPAVEEQSTLSQTTASPQGDMATPSPSTATATTSATTTTIGTPPGWPLQPEQPSSNNTTSAKPPVSPPAAIGPVGARIDREGDAVLCGEANASGKSNKRLISDRIVGGHKTEPGEFPFQVRLNIRSRRGSGICGGVVLDMRHVLTAAHCVTACVSHQLTTATIESSGVKVTVGDHSIKSDDGELELETETITPHEKYDACNFYANDHDIAIIKTAAPIPFKFTTDGYGSVNRPCMPASRDVRYKDGEPVIVSGWGVTRENSGALSNILRYVQVPVVNITRCQETYGSRVTPDHICAGFQAGGKDSCQGDSGGPLVRVVDNRYELVGIVSFGYGCGQAGAAGVYTRVASYLDWIKANTKDL